MKFKFNVGDRVLYKKIEYEPFLPLQGTIGVVKRTRCDDSEFPYTVLWENRRNDGLLMKEEELVLASAKPLKQKEYSDKEWQATVGA